MSAHLNRLFAFLLLLIISSSLYSQKGGTAGDMTYKERQRFERLFVDASKAKILGDYEQSIKLFEQCIKINKSQPAPYYEVGPLYMQFGEVNEALTNASIAADLDPENYYYRAMYAEMLKNDQQLGEAAEELEKIKKDFPEKISTYLDLALIYVLQKEYKSAIETYDELEEMMGPNEEIKLKKQYLYIQAGDVNKAAKEIEALIELTPNESEYYLLLAEMYFANGMEDKALKTYKRATAEFPDDARVQLSLAEYYRSKEDYKKAIEHLKAAFRDVNLDVDLKVQTVLALFDLAAQDPSYQKDIAELGEVLLKAHPEDARILTINGDIAMNLNNPELARKYFMKALDYDNSRFPIWSQLMILEADLRIYDTLILHAEQASDLFPNQPTVFYFKGFAENQLKQYEASVTSYERGAKLVIDNDLLLIQFYLGIADASNELEDYKKSDAAFEKVLSMDPNNTIALNNYSYYLSLRGERLDEALEMSAKSNDLEINQPTYLDTYAWIYYQLGQYEEAKKVMEKALIHGGDKSGVIVEHMGDILYQMGDKEEALKYWKKASQFSDTSELLEKKIKDEKLYE